MSGSVIKKGIIVFALMFFLLAPLSALNGNSITASAQATPSAQAPVTSCAWYNWHRDLPRCVVRPVMNWFGSWLLTLGAAFLLLAGTAFDFFLNLLVVNFSQTITDYNILGGIQQGWQLFRDIANIAIIGVFVFVAIMTILGSGEYGAKRLVANVLIVAILINFSLLFTRIVIESTNFLSAQFARAMPTNPDGSVGTAQSFLDAFGIKNWYDTGDITTQVSEKSDSSTIGLFYGFFGFVLLVSIGLVLFYGVFVISARALLLIFMMLTSSLAFATFLLPRWSNQSFIGWNNWWSNLIKAAVFGPLLMVFLWIAMVIIRQAAAAAQVGDGVRMIAQDPSKATAEAWGSIILLMIGTGFLFIAIRSASSFASSIGGFNFAGMLPLQLSGWAARNTIGPAALALGYRNDKLLSDARKERDRMLLESQRPGSGVTSAQVRQAQRVVDNLVKDSSVYNKLAKSAFNPKDVNFKQLAKKAGLGVLAGGKPESYGAYAERVAKDSAKLAEKNATTGDEKKEIVREQKELIALQKENATKQLATAEKTLEAVRNSTAHQGQQAVQKEAIDEIKKINSRAEEHLEQMKRSGASESDIRNRMAERDSTLRKEEAKIEKARSTIVGLEKNALNKVLENKDKITSLSAQDKDIKNRLNELSNQQTRETAAQYAAGWFGSRDSTVANMARDAVKKSKKEKEDGHSILKALKKEIEHGDESGDTHKEGEKHS